ncbi:MULTISPECIES: AlpA family transcriptional regulator [Paraburkholderia]|uniref:helix-turn-helix transcriptional regulator n=1 Tax=Paraburkholderia TaxID=1822464 RepID=UPI0022541F63|nr:MULTISPECIES: AlpA family phage regulatory protein [Paraburkholderia]MCX4165127.1 AlpA family phage regulatory protein [Paraburkholderia megapolitana]MDN7160620.1 AlpA family phage regulatory protein [Paraburkholderia sp. CHISQ3]MDQ6497667.1 AlpA family phage regulatory protein [Paraburkholderia megapolitana]
MRALTLFQIAMGSLKFYPSPPLLSAAPIDCDTAASIASPPQSPHVAPSKDYVNLDELPRRMRRRITQNGRFANPSANESAATNMIAVSDRIIRMAELLEILQIGRTTAYEMMKRGSLPQSIRIGARAIGWKLSDIERFLAALGTTEAHDD